jgi:nicotinamidase-related amidase
VFVDMQQKYLAKPRLLAISNIDHAPDKCRRVLDQARKIALPLAFIPSCSSCEPFTAMMNQSRGGIVLAGFAGESICPSTSIDAFHRSHQVAYLCDASASRARDDVAANDVHCAVSKISGLHGEVYETTDWIASTLPRKLGNGKNAGG